MSTTDTERYVRITLLTFEGGLWIARKILMREVDRSGALTLDDLLLGNNTLLQKKRRDITKRQYETLFPISGNDTNIAEWDLSLLIRIIKILFDLVLSGQDRYSLDELLRIRNDIVSHASQPSLSEQDFYTHSAKLTMCIESLAANFDVATTQYAADLTQRLSRGPLDLQSSIEQIAKLCRNDEHMENVQESLAIQERKLNEVASGVALSNQKIDDVLAVVREIKRTQSERGEDVCRVEIPLLNTTVCISGKKDEVVKLAQDILLKVHKTAIDKVENPDDEATVTDAVQQFLADIENKGAVVVSAESGSIILKIRCNDLVGLENMLSLFRDNENRCRLFGIENALNAVLLDAVKVELVLPDNTIAMLREWKENGARVNKRYLNLGIQCDSVEAAVDVMKYLQSDESANRLNQIAEAMSRVVGDQVKVDAVPDVERFSQGLEPPAPPITSPQNRKVVIQVGGGAPSRPPTKAPKNDHAPPPLGRPPKALDTYEASGPTPARPPKSVALPAQPERTPKIIQSSGSNLVSSGRQAQSPPTPPDLPGRPPKVPMRRPSINKGSDSHPTMPEMPLKTIQSSGSNLVSPGRQAHSSPTPPGLQGRPPKVPMRRPSIHKGSDLHPPMHELGKRFCFHGIEEFPKPEPFGKKARAKLEGRFCYHGIEEFPDIEPFVNTKKTRTSMSMSMKRLDHKVSDVPPRGMMDDQSPDSSSLGASDISARSGLIGLPEPAERGARNKPTRTSGRACITTTVVALAILTAALAILLAAWLADPHSGPVVGASDSSTRSETVGLQEPAEQVARYIPTRASDTACTMALLVSAALTLLLAVWLADRYSRQVDRNPQTGRLSREDGRKTLAEYVVDIDVLDHKEAVMDSNFISGSVVMHGEKLVKYRNRKVKLIDLKTNTVVAQLYLPGTLWDITQISDTQVAVTAGYKQTIYFVNVSNELKLDHSIQLNGKCAGITRLHDSLLVTYIDPVKVEILNMKGQLVQTVLTETQGERLFMYPRYVAVSPDQSTIYISDFDRKTVTRLSLTGKVLATYQDKASLDGPRGLVVDKSGSVYVCGYHSHNVLQLAADLTQPRQLIQESDGVKWPRSVSYCQATDRLYIGMWRSRVVKNYQLK